MQPPLPTLNELLRKTAGGQDLTPKERSAVKRSYNELRRQALESLDAAADEALMRAAITSGDQDFRADGILWTLRQFEARKMTLEDTHRELFSIFRHPHDPQRVRSTLRAEIAFHLAMSSILQRSQRSTHNRAMDLCMILELLANLSRLEQAVKDYERYENSRVMRLTSA